MRHLVIGKGQVGSAMIEVLSAGHNVTGIDLGDTANGRFEVLHVCIPYNQHFEQAMDNYIGKYLADDGLIIIHSTMNVGISSKFDAVHSPIRGIHPNLAGGIRTFEKFFGGPRAEEAANFFRALGITCTTTAKAESTEALKLWDTTYYGWNIVFEKAVKAYCDHHGLDFDIVYTQANRGYNEGYIALGKPQFVRPVLAHSDGQIGGHCVIPNANILGTEIGDFILRKNREYAGDAAVMDVHPTLRIAENVDIEIADSVD